MQRNSSKSCQADDKIKFFPFVVCVYKTVYFTYILLSRYTAFQIQCSLRNVVKKLEAKISDLKLLFVFGR